MTIPEQHEREESLEWKSAYKNQQLVERRRNKHRGKLELLGVQAWERDLALLDLCCGTGEVLEILDDLGFRKINGLDVSVGEELLKDPRFDLTVASARALPFSNGQFKNVICMHALHHLGGTQGVDASLKEAVRVLEPGGRLALIDHYDSPQLRCAFWLCQQAWFAWLTPGLKSFRLQLIEEHDYLFNYLDHFSEIRTSIEALGLKPVLKKRDAFFFYWVGIKTI